MRKAMLLLAVFGLVGVLWAADPFAGTWKMNPAKSKFNNLALKSYTVTQDNQNSIVQDMVFGEGNAVHRTWTAKYDGKDYHVTAPDADTISLKKPNANTIQYVVKKDGKEAWSGKAVLSKSGKSYIDAGSGRDAKGQAYTYSVFMEKQ